MKKSVLRVAAVGAVAALFATMSPMAHAASTPAYDTTTDARIYLVDGTAYTQLSAGTQLDWNTAAGVVLSAAPVPADLGDYSWAAFPAPTGTAVKYTGFISPVGSERTPSAWKQYGTFSSIPATGASLPSVWPGQLGNGTPAAVKAAGGLYSMGIAYTDSAVVASTHVVKAYYTTINVDGGTGTWTFAEPATIIPPTDIATTTTIAAAPTTLDVGQSTVLTAAVSASKTVTGNVQFFEGTTSLGTVGLSAGTATKSVTVATAGPHTYTAKFLGNLVGLDNFLASTSATGATVTAAVPAVQLPPNAPSENSLNTNTANGATASYDAATHKATLTVNASNTGKTVNTFVYSAPIFLGQLTVVGTTITFDVSVLPAGDHKMVIVDPATGDVLAWGTFTKSDAAISPSVSKTINADVANGTGNPSDGEFSIIDTSGSNVVNLTNPALVNGQSVVSGKLGTFKVTDLRQVSKQGWDLKTTVAQFVHGTDTIENTALNITPTSALLNSGTGTSPAVLGGASGGIYPWTFASLAAGSFSGVSTFNADLVFTAPAAKPAGTYTSTLTLTLISK
jgi:Bacterial Ig-like domain (group 3)